MSQTARRVTIHVVRERPKPVEVTPVREAANDKNGSTMFTTRSKSCDDNCHAIWDPSKASSKPNRRLFQPRHILTSTAPPSPPPMSMTRARNFSLPHSNHPLSPGPISPYARPMPASDLTIEGKRRPSTDSHYSDDSLPESPASSLGSDSDPIDILQHAGHTARQRRKRVHLT